MTNTCYNSFTPICCLCKYTTFAVGLSAIKTTSTSFTFSAFAFGSVTLDGLHIASYFERPEQQTCDSRIFILVYVMHLLFTFVQTFFLFKNHKVRYVFRTSARILRTMPLHLQKPQGNIYTHQPLTFMHTYI